MIHVTKENADAAKLVLAGRGNYSHWVDEFLTRKANAARLQHRADEAASEQKKLGKNFSEGNREELARLSGYVKELRALKKVEDSLAERALLRLPNLPDEEIPTGSEDQAVIIKYGPTTIRPRNDTDCGNRFFISEEEPEVTAARNEWLHEQARHQLKWILELCPEMLVQTCMLIGEASGCS